MIIRSQDKRKIETFERAFVDDGCRTVYVNGLNMGEYSTEEKAIKVLDKICDACRNIAFIDEQAVVFNMPQESEV